MSERFFKAPNRIFEIGLSSSEMIVLLYLMRCADKDGICFPSYTDITEKCKLSRPTVSAALKVLDDRKLAVKIERGYSGPYGVKKANTYRVKIV